MSSIRDSQPYALTAFQNLSKANNYSFSKGVGEIVDDSFDANGNQFIASICLPDEHVLLFFNDGENLPDISVLRGLSEKLTGKGEDKIGLMNKGYMASECFFEPDRVINMSRDENKDPTVLQYNSGQHYKDIRGSRENYADPKLVPHKYMSQGVLDLKILPYLMNLFSKVKHPLLQKKLKGTLEVDASKGTSQFFMTLWRFQPGHKFFGTLDEQLKSCVRNFNFYHGLILKEGVRTITSEYSDGNNEVLSRITAQDLHAGSSKLRADCDVHLGFLKDNIETVVLKVTLSMDTFPGSDTFWITNQPTNGQFKETQPLYAEPQMLREKKLPHFGSFVAFLSILNEKEAHAQLRAFGGEFSDVNSLRGIFLAWNNRYLGRAWWDDNWGASRNAGHVRAEIQIRKNRALIQKLFNIQTDKSQMSCDDAHPVAKRFLQHFMGNPIKQIFQSQKKTKQEKENEDFKYQYAWNPTQMYNAIKYGELTAEVAAERKNLLNGIAPIKPQQVSSAPAPAPAPAKPVPSTSVVAQLIAPVAPKPAPSNPIVQPKPKKEKSRTPSPEIRPAQSKTPVGPFERSTSKSPQDLMKEVMEFAEAILNSTIHDTFETASNTTQKGLVEHVNALHAIKKSLFGLGVKFDA